MTGARPPPAKLCLASWQLSLAFQLTAELELNPGTIWSIQPAMFESRRETHMNQAKSTIHKSCGFSAVDLHIQLIRYI